MKCGHCGSPLRVKAGEAYADCEYCGHSTRVRTARTLIAEAATASPAKKSPAKKSPNRPARNKRDARREPERSSEAKPSASKRANRTGSSCSGAIGLLAVLAGIAFPVYLDHGEQLREMFGASSLPFFGADESDLPLPTLVLDTPGERSLEGSAEGAVDASELAGDSCDGGHVRRRADVQVETVREGIVHFNVSGPGDLTLVVRTSEGVWLCDDDSAGGLLPRIVETLPVGVHQVWVGRFHTSEAIGYRLSVSEDMPGLPAPEASTEAKPESRQRPRRSARSRRRNNSSMRETGASEPADESRAPSDEASDQASGEASTQAVPPTPSVSTSGPRGLLSVDTTPWSRVRVNGRVIGRTPRPNVVVQVGDVLVEVQREGQGPWEQLPAHVSAGEPLELRHDFR